MKFNNDSKDDILRIYKTSDGLTWAKIYLSNGYSYVPFGSAMNVGLWVEGGQVVKNYIAKITDSNNIKEALIRIYCLSNGFTYVLIANSNGINFDIISNNSFIGMWSEGGEEVKNIILDVNKDGKDEIVRIFKNNGDALTQVSFYSNGVFTPTNVYSNIGLWTENGYNVNHYGSIIK